MTFFDITRPSVVQFSWDSRACHWAWPSQSLQHSFWRAVPASQFPQSPYGQMLFWLGHLHPPPPHPPLAQPWQLQRYLCHSFWVGPSCPLPPGRATLWRHWSLQTAEVPQDTRCWICGSSPGMSGSSSIPSHRCSPKHDCLVQPGQTQLVLTKILSEGFLRRWHIFGKASSWASASAACLVQPGQTQLVLTKILSEGFLRRWHIFGKE